MQNLPPGFQYDPRQQPAPSSMPGGNATVPSQQHVHSHPPHMTSQYSNPHPSTASVAGGAVVRPIPLPSGSSPRSETSVPPTNTGDVLPPFPQPASARSTNIQHPSNTPLPSQHMPGVAGPLQPAYPPHQPYPESQQFHPFFADPSRPPSVQSCAASDAGWSDRPDTSSAEDLGWLGTAAHLTAAGGIAYLCRDRPLLCKIATAAVRTATTAWSVYSSIPPDHPAEWAQFNQPPGTAQSQQSDFTDRFRQYVSSLGQQRTSDTVKTLAGGVTELGATVALSNLGLTAFSPWNYAASKVASQLSRAAVNGFFDPPPS